MNNPMTEGKRIKTGYDYYAAGFSGPQLAEAYYLLIASKQQEALLLESATLDEIAEAYSPGEPFEEWEENIGRLNTEEGSIFEAVRVRKFARTEKTMAALVRVLNNHLKDKNITAQTPIINKPRKSGLFATVAVQIPMSDGQVVSIIFHSPDNNKMKITAEDEIIAFRWLLNKRDITHVVSPENEAEVSLQEVGKRTAQLVEKNSVRYQAKQKDLVEQRKQMEDLKAQADEIVKQHDEKMYQLKETEDASEALEAKIANLKDRIEKQKAFNEDLQAKIDALKAQQAGNDGKSKVGDTPKTEAEMKAEQERAAFQKGAEEFNAELTGRGFKETGSKEWPDYELAIGGNAITIKAGWGAKENPALYFLINGQEEGKTEFTVKTYANGHKKALAWIDKKIAEIKKEEEKQAKAKQEEEAAKMLKEREERDKQVDEANRLVAVGQAAVPGIRLQDAETAGKLSEMKGRGELSQEDWDKYVADLKASNKIVSKKEENSASDKDTPAEPAAVAILNDILSGKYDDDSAKLGDMLDQAFDDLEKDGKAAEYDGLLNKAADYLTEILKREAA